MHIRTNKILNVVLRPVIWVAEWFGKHYPVQLVQIRYFVRFHRRLNLDAPQTLNEKILYLSLRTDTSLWTKCADKYEVREYVKEKGLENILVKLYGVWENPNDIDLNLLPNQFILKSTHGSGDAIIISDKNTANWTQIKSEFTRNLKKGYGALEGGIHYMRIKPRMIAEELLHNDLESQNYSSSLIDYKIWCFNGKAHYILTCSNRTKKRLDLMTYDVDWVAHPDYTVLNREFGVGEQMPKPYNFDRMIYIAEKLAENFPVIRVDLYNIAGKIYFGELTFTSQGGMMNYHTEEFQRHAGDLIDLNYNVAK